MVFVAGVEGSTGVGVTGVVGVTVVVVLYLSQRLPPFPIMAVLVVPFFVPVVFGTGSRIGVPTIYSSALRPKTGAPRSIVPFLTCVTSFCFILASDFADYSFVSLTSASIANSTTTEPW